MARIEQRQGPSPALMVVLGALAVFGAVVLLQWFLNWIVGWIKLIILIVVVIAVAVAVVSAKGNR